MPFVVDVAKVDQGTTTILCEAVHGDKALNLSQIYHIIVNMKVARDTPDKRCDNAKQMECMNYMVRAVCTFVEEDRNMTLPFVLP